MGLFSDPRVEMLMQQVSSLASRVEKLENEARYIADQPQQSYYFNALSQYQAMQNAQPLFNEVPINDVVKAIVKHLDMQIEKVAEQTTKTPQEVKVVAKQPSVTITGADGLGTTWANVAPMPTPKPKRKRKAK